MSRPPKISKEAILQASLDLLISEGYANVTIKNIAQKLNCSTQPISWHFGSMNAFREALLPYALRYVKENYSIELENPFYSFYLTGRAHLDMALKAPNLFRFLYMGESGMRFNKKYASPTYSTSQIAEFLGISTTEATELIQALLFYAHGISSMVVSGTLNEPDEFILETADNVSIRLLISYGVPPETASNLIKGSVNATLNMLS